MKRKRTILMFSVMVMNEMKTVLNYGEKISYDDLISLEYEDVLPDGRLEKILRMYTGYGMRSEVKKLMNEFF